MVFAFSISRFYLTSLSRLAAWMPPLVKGDKDIPFDQHEQKQSTALFAAQVLALPEKSRASPTQIDLNFSQNIRQ
jgi:hypothetical protein